MAPPPESPSRTLQRPRAAIFLAGSLALHLAALLAFAALETPPPVALDKIEFTVTEPTTVAPPAAKREETAAKQVVEQDQRPNAEADPNAKYLGRHDQKVERQTRAKDHGRFQNQGAPPAGARPETRPSARKPDARGDRVALKDLVPRFDPARAPDRAARAPATAAATAPGARTDDYLKDVEVGRQTLLSTREFVYFGYYARIKDSLRQHWEPEVRERVKIAYRRGRGVAMARDRLTQVLVTLDARGELIQIDLLTRSGAVDLDGAAIEAFRRAAPFPNPPKGMVEADGTVRIRWDFVLES